jgi:hypothetical protein
MEPKLIANYASGLNQVYKPWIMPEDAFPTLNNAYVWRGNILKRQGYASISDPSQPTPLAPGPVMGLVTRLDAENGDPNLVAFNTTNAYSYDPVSKLFTDISGSTVWSGTTTDFFWSDNSFRALFVTNNFDPIRYYNQYDGTWYDLIPIVNGTTTLDACLILVSHKQRLIAFNTVESGQRFAQRARWCQIANPYATGTPPSTFTLSPTAWRDETPGKGGFIDAPTSEDIISVGLNRDNILVFFESSTWRLRYTGNAFNPFDWEQVNSQLGCESTFSTVDFDEVVFATSRRGIVGANTNQLQRVDNQIPDIAVNFDSQNNGLKRIHGARHYYRELALWIYGDGESVDHLPDKILCYNYKQPSWATWDASFTCFGNAATTSSLTWDTAEFTWDSPTAAALTWESSSDTSGSPFLLAGDANGVVYEILSGTQDITTNFGFDVLTKRFMFYGEQGKKARLYYADLYVTGTTGGEITVDHYIDEGSVPTRTVTVSTSSTKDTLYTRVYLGAIGRTHQLRFYLSPSQLADPIKGAAIFELQAMVLWVSPAGRINDP